MELKEFVKKVIIDLDEAISEANDAAKREVRFRGVKGQRTSLEFDVAVTVESALGGSGGGGIKVWGIGQVDGKGNYEQINSTVSRVSFGVDISNFTKNEMEEKNRQLNSMASSIRNDFGL